MKKCQKIAQAVSMQYIVQNVNLKGENVIYYLGLKPKDCPLTEIEDKKIKDYIE